MRRRKNLTLLEVMLAFMIISLALGAIGLSGAKLLRGERLAKACEMVKSKVAYACDMALLTQSDQNVTLMKEEEGITCLFAGQKTLIKGIDHLFLNGEEKDEITLTLSQGECVTKNELGLGASQEIKKIIINSR